MDEITQLQKKNDESNAYKYFLQLIKKEAEREKTELSLLTTLLTLMDHHYMESIDTDTRL
jgi:Trp operon repressor